MDQPPSSRLVAVRPLESPRWVVEAVVAGGAEVVEPREARGIVWGSPRDVEGLSRVLEENPGVAWVQLPFAGIENFMPIIDANRIWTCGKGVYAEPVAEHALALTLAGVRHVGGYARAGQWGGPVGRNLLGASVTILGGGGITQSLVRLLGGFECDITVVRKHVAHMEGVSTVVDTGNLVDALAGADVVVLALALTPDTTHIIGRTELEVMETHAWLVNVARGRHIVTDDLVWALENNVIGGAALDVTEPEPLPPGHRLWSLPNCLITPHVGNTPEMAVPLLSARITENVRRFVAGDELIGLVDVADGY